MISGGMGAEIHSKRVWAAAGVTVEMAKTETQRPAARTSKDRSGRVRSIWLDINGSVRSIGKEVMKITAIPLRTVINLTLRTFSVEKGLCLVVFNVVICFEQA